MSQTRGERIVAIETKIDGLTEKIDTISDTLSKHIVWEEKKYEAMKQEIKKEYAPKWVEKVVYLLIASIIGIALNTIM